MSALTALWQQFQYRFSPTKKDNIVFTSFDGHYSDSPKYIALAMQDIDPSKNIIWLVKKQYINSVPQNFICIDIESPEAFGALRSAAVIVDNVYGNRGYTVKNSYSSKLKALLLSFLYNKKSQRVYTTWHGTPLKRMGRDQLGNNICNFVCSNMTMICGNQFTLDIMDHLTYGKIKPVLLGSPRNDLLFATETQRACLRQKLGLPNNKKTLLYAPTFRNDGPDTDGKNVLRSGINQLQLIDFSKLFSLLSSKFGGDWVFVCRFHYHVAEMVDWGKMECDYAGRVINGNLNDDMSEYLACADALLTDASSCMFDFSLTNRPCFLFFPDLDNYANRERGLYMDIGNLPYPASRTFDELLNSISSFSSVEYTEKNLVLRNHLLCVDDSDSARKVAEYILNEWNN